MPPVQLHPPVHAHELHVHDNALVHVHADVHIHHQPCSPPSSGVLCMFPSPVFVQKVIFCVLLSAHITCTSVHYCSSVSIQKQIAQCT